VTKQIILSSDANVAFTAAQLEDLERLLSLRGNVQAIREGLQGKIKMLKVKNDEQSVSPTFTFFLLFSRIGLIKAIYHVLLSCIPPLMRRVPCLCWSRRLSDADWCLQSDGMPSDPRGSSLSLSRARALSIFPHSLSPSL